MTNEEREAINRLEKRIKDNKDYKTTQVWLTDDVVATQIVLSLIKEQQEEIENITTNYKNLIADVSMLAKELGLEEDATIDEIYTAIRILKSKRINVIEQLDCIEKKDKQIDLMAEIFYKRFKAELLLEYGFENEEQLKQYFADLVEKE